jgi:hypothetical protein
MADVFLHVGLAKTGTTTIQAALEARSSQLADDGVLFAGGSHRAQRLAVYDLLGQRVKGDDKDVVAGAFERLVDEISAHTGRSVVVSEEELSLVRPRHVRKLVRRLAGHRVFVVVGVRDMARTLVSAWQQSVVTGGVTPWQHFIESVRDDHQAVVTSDGVSFWLRHDALRVIDTWRSAVPAERFRIITVPPSGADSGVLLDRFARAAELPVGIWESRTVLPRNVSLGVAELEVVRRLNVAVRDRLDLAQYRFVVEAGIRPRLRVERSRPLRLPPEHLPWTRLYGERLAAELRQRGLEIIGDLSDLFPGDPSGPATPLDVVSDDELLTAAEGVLASLALAHGRLFKRYQRAFVAREGRWPTATELIGSRARATGFRVQKAALRRADHNRVLAWAARTYLERTSRTTARNRHP